MLKLKSMVSLIVLIGLIMSCSSKSDYGVTQKKLANGLTVLVKEDHSSPVVAIVTYVKTGYFNEPDSLTGISHLLEHMFFKGTELRGVGEIARETKNAGGYFNAGTIYDHTSYYTVLPSNSFNEGLDIQSDALINCAIDPDELMKESKVVIQEIKRKLDNPDAYSFEKLLELGFDVHRIRRWRMGYESQVSGWSREQVFDYYQTRYRPDNIILSIVGDIDTKPALDSIQKYYGVFAKGNLQTEQSPPEPSQKEFKYKRLTGDISQKILHIGFHVPGMLDNDHYPLVLMNYILSEGRASRLNQRIKEEQRLAQSVGSYYDAYNDFGYFTFSADQQEENSLDLLKAIFQQIEALKLNPVTQEELVRAQNQLESGYLHSFEDVSGQAQTLAMYQSYGNYRLAYEYLDKLRQVTPEEIQAAAKKYFDLANCAVLEYFPEDNKSEELTSQQLADTLTAAMNGYQATDEDMTHNYIPQQLNHGVGGKDLPDEVVKMQTLADAITVICKQRHSLPLVSVAAYFYGGMFTENEADAGITDMMARVSLKGTTSLTASQIAQQTEILGSNISYTVDNDYFGYTLDAIARNFEDAFSIYSDIILNPSFPEDELDKEKTNQLAAISRQKDSMGNYPIELCTQALFEGDPYGLPSLGNPDAIKSFTVDDLKKRHADGVVTGNLVITFVGDITLEQAVELTQKYFKDMPRAPRVASPKVDVQLSSIHAKIEKRDKAQTAQAFAFPTCSYASPDHEPLKVFQNIVSGMGGRLYTEVRDKRSLAYTIYGYQSADALAGSFICYMATSPGTALEARRIALNVLKDFINQPPGDEEVQRSINYTAGSFSIYLQPNSVQANLYTVWQLDGKGYEAVDSYADMIRKVSTDRVIEVAQKYFQTPYYALGMIEGEGASVKERE